MARRTWPPPGHFAVGQTHAEKGANPTAGHVADYVFAKARCQMQGMRSTWLRLTMPDPSAPGGTLAPGSFLEDGDPKCAW